ncbi:MAG: gamma carbonic anhydrase family protein [Nitrososphaerales archaeon]
MPVQDYLGKSPKIPRSSFVASNATIIGNVELHEESSVWFGSVLRCEVEHISIGSRSNIQDNSTLHTDIGFPVEIGEGVSIGHGVVVHGAKVGSNCLVGMRATLLNGSVIGENSIVAAGSLVTQGKEMPPNTLVMGSPAIAKRRLREDEIERIRLNANHYNELRAEYLKLG